MAEPAFSTPAVDPLRPLGRVGDLLGHVVDASGSPRFVPALLAALCEYAGVEHCAIFEFDSKRVRLLGAASMDASGRALTQSQRYVSQGHWRADPTLTEAFLCDDRQTRLFRVDPHQLRDLRLRDDIYLRQHVVERLFATAHRDGGCFGISLLRTRESGEFGQGECQRLAAIAGFLVSLAAGHARWMQFGQASHEVALSSIPLIEGGLASAFPMLTPRERQVCACMLYGLTGEAIGSMLGIGAETVSTYRKRSYLKLGIASWHELLRLYLGSVTGGRPGARRH